MKILVTGAKGFVGKNLCAQLKAIRDGKDRRFPDLTVEEIMEYDIDSTPEQLDEYCAKADFVFNLAGVNRPKDPEDFKKGNFGFASTLLDTLKKHGNRCPVMLSSSIQATLKGRYAGHPYGESKKAGEDLFFDYARETGAKVYVYRFPNLFGKWCRPNYNSVIATFCHNIANDLPIQVNDPSVELELLYIDDLVDEMIRVLEGHKAPLNPPTRGTEDSEAVCGDGQAGGHGEGFSDAPDSLPCGEGRGVASPFCYVPHTHHVTLGKIVELLNQFKEQPKTLVMPEMPEGSFAKALYSTYLSYLPKEKVAFPLKMNVDNRGSFTELVKSANVGQVSINISKPGITKGEHWHNTKWEQFIVVKGHALILQRNIAPPQPSPQGREPSASEEFSKVPLVGGFRGASGDGVLPRQADPINYKLMKKNASDHRRNPTEAESVMWDILRNKGLDVKFRRQHAIGEYIVDFVCLEKGLVVELDGGYHNDPEQRESDYNRTQWLQKNNYSVIRFTNEEVLFDTDNIVGILKNALKHLPLVEGLRGAFSSGYYIEAVHMLPGYTHNIVNLSDTEDLVTVMYCNECFDPNHPDTFFEKV